MKKIYFSPKISVSEITVNPILISSEQVSEIDALYRKSCKEGSYFQRCPFNHKWCYDKQKVFNIWRKAVEEKAKNQVNYMFCTNGEDHCPHRFTGVFADCKQKQRG